MRRQAPRSKSWRIAMHRHALRARVTDHGVVCGGGIGRSAQSQTTTGAPGGICDKPRRWRMPLAKAASEMVRGEAIGSVSRKMDAGRLAQLRSRACDLRPEAPAEPKRSRRDWKAPAAAQREYSRCANGSTSRMKGEVRARVSSGQRPAGQRGGSPTGSGGRGGWSRQMVGARPGCAAWPPASGLPLTVGRLRPLGRSCAGSRNRRDSWAGRVGRPLGSLLHADGA
jgi:hypothetical protein